MIVVAIAFFNNPCSLKILPPIIIAKNTEILFIESTSATEAIFIACICVYLYVMVKSAKIKIHFQEFFNGDFICFDFPEKIMRDMKIIAKNKC